MTAHPRDDERLLRSWKEIAAYLHVDVRTAQRWHGRTDIPIYNRRVGSRTHPAAYPHELDRWMTQRADTTGNHPAEPPHAGPAPAPRRRTWWFTLTGAALLVLATAGWAFRFGFSATGTLHHVELVHGRVRALTADNRLLWHQALPGSGRIFQPQPTDIKADTSLVVDVDGDSRPDALVNVLADPNGVPSHLVAYGHDGRVIWDYRYDRTRSWRGQRFDPTYDGRVMRVVRTGGDTYVLAVAVHDRWFPSQVLLLDARRGQLVDEYWHPGALVFCLLHDVDGDGAVEAVLTGISNPGGGLGHGALAVLKIPFSKGPPATEDNDMTAFSGGREVRYALFPRPDVCSVLGDLPFLQDPVTEQDGLLVRTACGSGSIFHLLDDSLKVRSIRFSDNYFPTRERLERQGDLSRPFSKVDRTCLADVLVVRSAVDGNDPGLADRWKACQ